MRVPIRLMSIAPMLLIGPPVAASPSATFSATISLGVPITCRVIHRGELARRGNDFSLGQLLAYCNAPGGFRVEVGYQPGSLRGTVVQAGDARVVLDGSGETELMHASGPKIATVDVSATPASSKFDPAALRFQIVAL